MAGKNNAAMCDIKTLIQMGINPVTGLPYKMSGADSETLETDIKRSLRILDEQNAIRRYRWYNLPNGLTSELIERILYYRGQAMFFYMDTDEKFYFLPYALDGTIDVYGRFRTVTPVSFNGVNKDSKNKAWITGLTRDVVYEMPLDDNNNYYDKGCVILHDYCKQMSETNISRSIIQEPILGAMAEAFPMARTSLIANSGVKGMRVNDADQQTQVRIASNSVTKAAKTGNPWIPIVGSVEFQDLTNAGTAMKSEEYLLYMQALDNFRLSLYGLKNGGLFQKKSHMLEAEQDMNNGNVGLIYEDGLTIRQEFCDLVNSIWDLGIYCEASETVVGMDTNGDGMLTDEEDQTGMNEGSQPMEVSYE